MQFVYKDVTFKGVFHQQKDDSNDRTLKMTFSAIGFNNESIWGSRIEASTEDVLADIMAAITLTEIGRAHV